MATNLIIFMLGIVVGIILAVCIAVWAEIRNG